MRILVWSPLINRGGGVRLLSCLIPALARQAKIETVRLAGPLGSIMEDRINAEGDLPVEFLHTTRRLRVWWERCYQILSMGYHMWSNPEFGGSRSRRLPLQKKLARWTPVWQNEQISAAARDCDLVYCFWPHGQAFPRVDRPVVCTIQDTTFLNFPELLGGWETLVEWLRTKEWVCRSRRVVVSSETTKQSLIRIYGSVCENAEVIHHAISPISPALTAGQHSLFLDRLPRRYVVYPGNISPQKNHYALFLAWSRFARRKKLPLVLFGDGTEVFRMRRPEWPEHWHSARLVGLLTRCDLRLGEDYFALGYVDDADANALIAHATALIMPSLAEGGGSYPVEEALSMGVPVLCSDIPVMREHLMQRSAKIAWFDPECPASILSALNTFFDNYEDFKESALRGMKDPRPTWDDVAAQYVDVFARVVEATRHANGSS